MRGKVDYKRGAFLESFMALEKPISDAATGAVREAAGRVKTEARSQIAASGFSKKWQNALRVDVYPRGGTSINAAAHVYHKIPYAHVFEEGAKIAGKPLLWLPLKSAPKKFARRRMTPEIYMSKIGPLQYVQRPGRNPLLVARVGVSAAAARRKKVSKQSVSALRRGYSGRGPMVQRSVPMFVGVSRVNLRKRFNIGGAVARAAGDLGALYMKHLEADE